MTYFLKCKLCKSICVEDVTCVRRDEEWTFTGKCCLCGEITDLEVLPKNERT